jgi:hypothetical protein
LRSMAVSKWLALSRHSRRDVLGLSFPRPDLTIWLASEPSEVGSHVNFE